MNIVLMSLSCIFLSTHLLSSYSFLLPEFTLTDFLTKVYNKPINIRKFHAQHRNQSFVRKGECDYQIRSTEKKWDSILVFRVAWGAVASCCQCCLVCILLLCQSVIVPNEASEITWYSEKSAFDQSRHHSLPCLRDRIVHPNLTTIAKHVSDKFRFGCEHHKAGKREGQCKLHAMGDTK